MTSLFDAKRRDPWRELAEYAAQLNGPKPGFTHFGPAQSAAPRAFGVEGLNTVGNIGQAITDEMFKGVFVDAPLAVANIALQGQLNIPQSVPETDPRASMDPMELQRNSIAKSFATTLLNWGVPGGPAQQNVSPIFIGPKLFKQFYPDEPLPKAQRAMEDYIPDVGAVPSHDWAMRTSNAFFDPFGNWKFEVPDEGFKYVPDYMRTVPMNLGDDLIEAFPAEVHHPKLPNLMEALGDPGIGEAQLPGNALGLFDPSNHNLFLSERIPEGADRLQESILLHEIQHLIQKHEGWQSGGNIEAMKTQPETLERFEELKSLYSQVDPTSWGQVGLPDDDQLMQIAAFETYQRLAGEAEARLVQSRFMDPELANYLHPELGYDIPPEMLLNFEFATPSAMEPKPGAVNDPGLKEAEDWIEQQWAQEAADDPSIGASPMQVLAPWEADFGKIVQMLGALGRDPNEINVALDPTKGLLEREQLSAPYISMFDQFKKGKLEVPPLTTWGGRGGKQMPALESTDEGVLNPELRRLYEEGITDPEVAERALAAGFDPENVYFHASDYLFPAFRKKAEWNRSEPVNFFTPDPEIAAGVYGKYTYPVLLNMQNPLDVEYPKHPMRAQERFMSNYDSATMDQIIRDMMTGGHDAAIVRNLKDTGPWGGPDVRQTQVLIPEPSQVRSIWAKFDPAQRESANLLAAQLGLPLEQVIMMMAGRSAGMDEEARR